jgi:hypothetical protein
MAILGANRSLATLDIPQRMSTASKLFAPNLDKRHLCGGMYIAGSWPLLVIDELIGLIYLKLRAC